MPETLEIRKGLNSDPERVIYIQTSDFNIQLRAVQARKNINALLSELDRINPATDEEYAELDDLSAFAGKTKADILREGIKMFRQYGKYED